jgi:formylglycine-generating enzyme
MIDKANILGGLGITHDNHGANQPATSIDWFEVAKFVNWLNTNSDAMPAYKFDGSGNFQLWDSGDAGYSPNDLFRNSLARNFLPRVDEWYKAAYYNPASGNYYDYPTGSDNLIDGIDFPGDTTFDAVFDTDNHVGVNPLPKRH